MRIIGLLLLLASCSEAAVPAANRNKLVWPFAATSIWNMPVGTGARYMPAGIQPVETSVFSPSFLIRTTDSDPLRPLIAPISSPDRCGGSLQLGMLRVPDNLVLSPQQNAGPGNAASFLQPDGHTLVEITALGRCEAGGPVVGFHYPDSDLLGDGRLGSQGGSGLSGLGGALVQGELYNGRPVRHALKVALPADRYYFGDPSRPATCFRWPADRCDGGFADPPDHGYHGLNPEFTMGSLLAIPPDVVENGVGLESVPGRAMFFTLQNYGVYVMGSAGVNWALWGMRDDAQASFKAALGTPGLAAWLRDVNRLLPLLAIVVNNAPDAIGGGGEPRQPLAPPLAE